MYSARARLPSSQRGAVEYRCSLVQTCVGAIQLANGPLYTCTHLHELVSCRHIALYSRRHTCCSRFLTAAVVGFRFMRIQHLSALISSSIKKATSRTVAPAIHRHRPRPAPECARSAPCQHIVEECALLVDRLL
jgi:hypothetical protein